MQKSSVRQLVEQAFADQHQSAFLLILMTNGSPNIQGTRRLSLFVRGHCGQVAGLIFGRSELVAWLSSCGSLVLRDSRRCGRSVIPAKHKRPSLEKEEIYL